MEYKNPFEQALSGLEIKDWIWHHSHHTTSFTSVAKRMNAFFNLDDNKFYMVALCNNVPTVIEVPEKGKVYEVPCEGDSRK